MSTQCALTTAATVMKKTFRSPFPVMNVKLRSEPVDTDTVYANNPAIGDGSKYAQVFVGTKTLVSDFYGMKSDKQFVNSLEDNIRQRGAMDKLISYSSQAEVIQRVKDTLRALFIEYWKSEDYLQHQKCADRRYQTIKRHTNILLNRTEAPPTPGY